MLHRYADPKLENCEEFPQGKPLDSQTKPKIPDKKVFSDLDDDDAAFLREAEEEGGE